MYWRTVIVFCLSMLLLAGASLAWARNQAPVPREVVIKDISKAGAEIDLMDGSKWRITDIDEQKLVYDSWLPAQVVIVEPGQKLRNIYTGEQVQALRLKKATKLPSPSPAAAKPGQPAPAPTAASGAPAALPPNLEAKLDKLLDKIEQLDLKIRMLDTRVNNLERGLGVMR